MEWPVVLLPSHRSYLDFILVSYVMFEHDIALPCIAAGQGSYVQCPLIFAKFGFPLPPSRLYVHAGNQPFASP